MIDQSLLSGLPNEVRALLASPPLADPRLLEWPSCGRASRLRGPGRPTRCGCSW
jgi:hypothetical protein